ncbi:uncharacterized protein LOC131890813 isoform X2 [Tigriopus californicus]|uniref:uncharacterized protein LOC131890813 isoform X2 n=1 Tax=Tigriopus californicus TaxID=6832 RepID=UPI0027DA7AFF|nr:uncharacterized protein LOC131890813 isoform X2 [Tigriopus californicus]
MALVHSDEVSLYEDQLGLSEKQGPKDQGTGGPQGHGDHFAIEGTPESPPRDYGKRIPQKRTRSSETEHEGIQRPQIPDYPDRSIDHSPLTKRPRPQTLEEDDLDEGEITITLPGLEEQFMSNDIGPCGDDGGSIGLFQSPHSSSEKENAAPLAVVGGSLPLSGDSLPFSSPPYSPGIANLSGLSGGEIREFPSSARSSQTIYYGESSSEDDVTPRRPSQSISRSRNVRRSLIFLPDQEDYLSPSIWDIED